VTLFDEPAPERPNVRRLSLVRLSAELARALGGIGKVAVEGEVHRPSVRPGGRIYFTLKDRAAQIDVTVPASRSKRSRAIDGERVLVTGVLEWNNSWGRLQLVAEEVVPVGAGAVAAMIAEARQRLRADGILDRPRTALPRLPQAIGVVCGSEAAVRADIESVVAARFPGYPMVFREVTMTSADAVVEGLVDLDGRDGVDVIILARGGGDATQLLPFSDEDLCRAICAASTPVVAAIGHEGDRPLCDEVVDLRCGTPSLAASAVVPDRDALVASLDADLERATAALRRRLDAATNRLGRADRGEQVVRRRVDDATHRLGRIDRNRAVTTGVDRAAERLRLAAGRLELVHPARLVGPATTKLAGVGREMDALSPVRVLERGYAVVRAGGVVVRDASAVAAGAALDIQVAAGRLAATVDEVAE
jgi:exodeoxyribonuclease VII large subunit